MATRILSSPTLPARRFSTASPCRKRRAIRVVVAAAGKETNGRDYGGRLVDESMMVLRMRIREMEMLERSHDQPPNSDWMGWEKRYFMYYKEDVCEAIGLLQNCLMNMRPSLALGILALVTLSVPISSGLLFFHVMEITKEILSTFHPT